MYPRVQFRRKLKKLLNGQSFKSARHHLRRSFHKSPFSLETNRVIQTIDAEQFEQVRRRYAVEDPGEDWPKYLDLNRWIDINIRRARQIELDTSPPLRILDLGCGAGYFAYIAQLLGHDVIGLDIDDVPMFAGITRLLGVPRTIWRVQPFVPLPDLGKHFDLVTAFMICFNNHKHPGLWGVPEWEFFLNDLARHLSPTGRVWLELNREYDGTCYTPELREFFERRGGKIDNQRVEFGRFIRTTPSPQSSP
jgi:SAM-dependent methyltransferase